VTESKIVSASSFSSPPSPSSSSVLGFYDLSAVDNAGQEIKFEKYKGKVVLIVNTASYCGYTDSNYKQLQQVYEKYQAQGLEILAFPCNQFGKQEPGSEDDIRSFAREKYGITFPLFRKVDVNGDEVHPVFSYLRDHLPGVVGTTSVKWNFTKFLVDHKGNPVKRYGTNEEPLSFEDDIKELLARRNQH